MESHNKEVYFHKYCATCKYENMVDKNRLPVEACETCLSMSYNVDSHKPIKYKEALK